MERLSTSLQNYNISALQEIAKNLDLQTQGRSARKAQLVGQLSRLIPQVARSRSFIRSLDPAERAALAIVLANDHQKATSSRDVACSLILGGFVQIEGQPNPTHRPSAQSVLSNLIHKGLLINLTAPYETATLRTLDFIQEFGMAPEVRAALPDDLLKQPEHAPADAQLETLPPKQYREGNPQQYLRSLFFMWAEIRRQPAKQLKAGGIAKRDRKRIAEALGQDSDRDTEKLERLREMLEALQLITSNEGFITATENDAATLFWNAKPTRQLPTLIRGYAQTTADLPDMGNEQRIHQYLEGLELRPQHEIRQQAVDMLNRVSSRGWISTGLLYSLLTGDSPGSLALGDERLAYLIRSIRWYGEGYRQELEEALHKLDWQLLQGILHELHAMGFIDLGFEQPEGRQLGQVITTIRVNALLRSDYVMRSASISREEPWQVILQPDYQMLAMGPVPLRVLANLERFSRREKLDESVVTYRIQRDTVYQAFQREETVETILGYLDEATEQPVPQNIVRSLEEWHRRYERIAIRRHVCILQTDNLELMETAMGDAILSQYLHRVNDTLAWVHPNDSEVLQARLLELEILPAHSRGPEAEVPNSLRWQDQDLVPTTALPSIYVTGLLRQIAEEDDGKWRLTHESAKMAATAGLDANTIITMLETMTGKPLPILWEKQLKAWGNYFGDGLTNQVRLLRLEREEALTELRRADRQLHRWLRPLPGAPQLAVVNETHWQDVEERLHSWGVKISTERWW